MPGVCALTRQEASIGGPPTPRGPRGSLSSPLKCLRAEGAERREPRRQVGSVNNLL